MRSRIRDDVIHNHKRETRLLCAVYGPTELKEKMRGRSWGLAEIAEEEEEAEQSQIENMAQSLAVSVYGSFGNSGPQAPDLCHSSQDGGTRKQLGECERLREEGRTATTNQARASEVCQPLVIFLAGQGPWSPLKYTYETPKIEKSKAADEPGWLPFLAGRASNLAFRTMLLVNPLHAGRPHASVAFLTIWNIDACHRPISRCGNYSILTRSCRPDGFNRYGLLRECTIGGWRIRLELPGSLHGRRSKGGTSGPTW